MVTRSGGRLRARVLVAVGAIAAMSAGMLATSPAALSAETVIFERLVSAQYTGTYNETYESGGQTYTIGYSFDITWQTIAEWTQGGLFKYQSQSPSELVAKGTLTRVEEGFPPETCNYSALPLSEEMPGFELHQESVGVVDVDAVMPNGSKYLTDTPANEEAKEFCAVNPSLATPGNPENNTAFTDAIAPVREIELANPQNQVPINASGQVENGTGTFAINATLIVKSINPLTITNPTSPSGQPEKHEPSTPITPPTTPPKPPVIQEPELGPEPPEVIGGGGPPKLRTGITAKCPKAGKPCTVTGVVEAELPAPRPAGKADASRKAKIRRVVLGKVSFPLAVGASKPVSIALSEAGVALLRSHPGVRAKIAVTVTAPGAVTASRTRTAKLRLPAPHRHR